MLRILTFKTHHQLTLVALLLSIYSQLSAMQNTPNANNPITVKTSINSGSSVIIDKNTKQILSTTGNKINFWSTNGQLINQFTNTKPDYNNCLAVNIGALYVTSRCGNEQVLSIFDKKTLKELSRHFLPNAGNIAQMRIHKDTGNIYLFDDKNSETEYKRFMYICNCQGQIIKTIDPSQHGLMRGFEIDQATGNIIINKAGWYVNDGITIINLDNKQVNSFKPSPESGLVDCYATQINQNNQLWCNVQSTIYGNDDIRLNLYDLNGRLLKQINLDDELYRVETDRCNFAATDDNTVTYFAQKENACIKVARADGGQKFIQYPNNNPDFETISIDMDSETKMVAATLDSHEFIIANQQNEQSYQKGGR